MGSGGCLYLWLVTEHTTSKANEASVTAIPSALWRADAGGCVHLGVRCQVVGQLCLCGEAAFDTRSSASMCLHRNRTLR
jgi:hypothetical protein